MVYAIVDIETTGGHASANGITEIAILLHDGERIVGQYERLINPGIPIPVYIRALTGITDEMLADAPTFAEVAKEIYDLLADKIFVAHNVNFDYSFLKYHLGAAGFDLQCRKLCTVRLGRKLLPGLSSYSLGKLCSQLSIDHGRRHRAGGDAAATAQLFSLLLSRDTEGYIGQVLMKNSREQQLPPNIHVSEVEQLPACPGVYYFRDQKDRVIYVGKAVNIRKRVLSHFTGNNSGRQRQEFLRNIHSIRCTPCGTELMAFILEAVEIKRLWPANNRALKRFEQTYGLYMFEDQKGYLRLMVDKRKRHSSPLLAFNSLLEGRNVLLSLLDTFRLCPRLCFIQTSCDACSGVEKGTCLGACAGREEPEAYNQRVLDAADYLQRSLPSFLLVDRGRSDDEKSVILIERGNMYGMGYLSPQIPLADVESVKSVTEQYPSNDYIRNLIFQHASRHPEKVVPLDLHQRVE